MRDTHKFYKSSISGITTMANVVTNTVRTIFRWFIFYAIVFFTLGYACGKGVLRVSCDPRSMINAQDRTNTERSVNPNTIIQRKQDNVTTAVRKDASSKIDYVKTRNSDSRLYIYMVRPGDTVSASAPKA